MAEVSKNREVRYLGRDFPALRNNLINYAKNYFPAVYRNFNESSVGMMFIEMAAYVGDVLSYYTDQSLKENLLLYAEEKGNLYALAQALGYRPNLAFPATVEVDVYQIVPAIGTGTNTRADYRYALRLSQNMQIASQADSSVVFRTLEDVNFAHSSSENPTDVAVYETDADNNPTFFLLKKGVKTAAGEIKTQDMSFDAPERFQKRTINEEGVMEILNATDADGNLWYHVPHLAQDTIFEELTNVAANDDTLNQFQGDAPYLLKLRKTARRFTSRLRSDNLWELNFGSGISDNPDELLIPNPTNIGSALFGSVTFADNSIDPSNFMATKTYGQAPNNTTLTVEYVVGGGSATNVNQNDLTKISDVTFNIEDDLLDSNTL